MAKPVATPAKIHHFVAKPRNSSEAESARGGVAPWPLLARRTTRTAVMPNVQRERAVATQNAYHFPDAASAPRITKYGRSDKDKRNARTFRLSTRGREARRRVSLLDTGMVVLAIHSNSSTRPSQERSQENESQPPDRGHER